MGTLRVYDFDGVLIPDKKNHNNIIVISIRSGKYPDGVSNADDAYALLKANPLGKEAREWVDMVFSNNGVRFVKSEPFRSALEYTSQNGGTSIIVSASSFEGVINYMLEKEGLSHIIPPENVFTVSSLNQALIPGLKAERIKEFAEILEYTNIVFLDDNKNNVQKVEQLDGVITEKGRLFVTAVKVDNKLGLEDKDVVEIARAKEMEYNERENHVYVNSGVEESINTDATSEEAIYEDLNYSSNRVEEALNIQRNEGAAAKEVDLYEKVEKADVGIQAERKAVKEQIKMLKEVLKSAKKKDRSADPALKDYLENVTKVLSELRFKLDNDLEVQNGPNFLQKVRNVFKTKKIPEQDRRLADIKRRESLKIMKSREVRPESKFADLVTQLSSSDSDDAIKVGFADGGLDLSKFTKSSVELRKGSSELPPPLAPKKNRKEEQLQIPPLPPKKNNSKTSPPAVAPKATVPKFR
ncbi:hypothetical protein [Flavobacterium poyangense]|uniref:hypothetical protein n=1 Tax=Flavobacterium poyangense TaxID=2204302 RepID=UPI00142272B7|nr:hypothetical protein [Flavobacterium sp. JXAS1]